MTSSVVIDCVGRPCPVPVIELARALPDVAVGEVVTVLADDPAAALDLPAFCRMRGHRFVGAAPLPDGRTGTAYDVERLS